MTQFDHWLVTRFNLPISPFIGLDPKWFHHRLSLFLKYCLPSVASQSCQDFRWLLLVDRDTPFDLLASLSYARHEQPFDVLPVGHNWLTELTSHLRRNARTGFLITTRLDNDDVLHPEHLATVQAAFRRQHFGFHEFPCGLQLDETTFSAFHIEVSSGPFLTLMERVGETAKTVYCHGHHLVKEIEGLTPLPLDPAWVQVVHSANLVNRISSSAKPVANSYLHEHFPFLSPPAGR
ncbi:glycosyltransferase [Planctomicrobium piriforme]|uniref:Putative rhamnosyl transferase n=1 Tax=Planctomicrobium piriforme TaxID=1576369 RepID=A0A1I3P307_9PLAN|nr:glycosyltransferase [Planctomicrobium piriforme]SFJ15819.1 Putative rhamnosyl transferase [Planctomicrobium piriforme]